MPPSNEEALFALALAKPAAERAAWLDRECGDDAALRARLDALLAAHDEPNKLIATAAVPAAKATMRVEFPEDQLDEAVGQTLGRYKLLERIGEGGCGVVYVAEQTEPVRRRVALKVIKLGMDTKQVVARFEAERQALAMMDHPNIAKVLDAGTTDVGRPYFVMELVRGIRITNYCDQANLTTKNRLDLFIKVCQAIQHAHQKGIIHRDIKPSNILVTLHDGVPVPKVIDFGIAKATEGRLTDATVYTQLHQFIGTPAYMSPEQAEMSGLDIDTRSDIYSLGVLLYELLTGKTPFDATELMASGIDAMRKTIRESEPLRPSTKLSQTLAAADEKRLKSQSTDTPSSEEEVRASSRRRLRVKETITLLRGDLDWIVMMCLEKDRTRRYDTATGLAADLKRHLDNEPVFARPPSTAYKFQKAWRRNKLVYSAGLVVVLALMAGVLVSSLQADRARKAETLAKARLAETERERDAKDQAREDAERVSQFLQQVFQSPDPARDGRTITVVESLDRAAKKLEEDLASQPERRARLQTALANTYASLGLHPSALRLWEQVRDYWLAAAGPDHLETLKATTSFAQSLFNNGQMQAALPLTEDLLTRTRQRYGSEDTNTLVLLRDYANVLDELGRAVEALKLREENLAAFSKVLGPEHRDTLIAMHNLEVSYYKLGMQEKSRPLQEEVVALSRKVLGPEHPETLQRLGNLGVDYKVAGRNAEAITLLEENLGKQRRVLGPEHPFTIHTMQTLSGCYFDTGRRPEALQLRETVLELYRNTLGAEHPSTIWPMLVLAESHAADGRGEEALMLMQEAQALSRKIHGPEHPETLGCLDKLAYLHFGAGRIEEAIQVGEESLALSRKALGSEEARTIHRAVQVAAYYRSASKHEEAIKLSHEIVSLRKRTSGSEHEDTVAAIKALADVHAAQGKWNDARTELLQLIEFKTLPDEAHFALMCLAALDVYLGEETSYEAHRKLMLKRFGSVNSPEIANRIAKSCLLLPWQGDELKVAVELAGQGVKRGENRPALHWYLLADSLAHYRAGKWTGAAECAQRSIVLSQEADSPASATAAFAVLALARHRLAQSAEARAALTGAVRLFEQKWPRLDGGNLGSSWHDVLIAHLLRREAAALIEGAAR